MLIKYKNKPTLVKSIRSLYHKGKRRGYIVDPHPHFKGEIEFIFVDYGKISLMIEEKTLIINPGECVLLRGEVKHTFEGVDGAPFDYLNIMFRGDIPPVLFDRVLAVNRKCFDLAARLKQEIINEQPYGSEVAAAYLTAFIACLVRQAEISVPEKMPQSANYKQFQSEFVNRALKIIAAEYAKPLNTEMLCKSVGIGESRLRVILKAETGKSFKTLLQEQRIAAAKHLLGEGSYSLAEISHRVGYEYPSFFFKVFKRITGLSPGAYAVSLGEPNITSDELSAKK
jgi:AraC-like DNA-binding protein